MTDRFTLRAKLGYLTGFSVPILLKTMIGTPYFFGTAWKYKRLNRRRTFNLKVLNLFPILSDRKADAGTAQGHYFHQDLWAARKIFIASPKRHIDIGSRVDGFVAHVLTFMPVTVIDIRQMTSEVQGLTFIREDATQLSQFADDSIESISTLHAAEHFGLGRYSDPVDPEACFRFMHALQRVLARGGNLYFSVPVGRERVEFNAHRVFSPLTIIKTYGSLRLVSFSYVDDDGRMHEDQDSSNASALNYGCGLFHFTKT